MLLEDDESIRRLVAEMLAEENMTVAITANGTSALREAVLRPPDAVILDLPRPDTEAAQLAEGVRNVCDRARGDGGVRRGDEAL